MKSRNQERNYAMEKIKTSKQRILVIALTLCMLFTLFAPATNVNAASKRAKALTAYQKKLKKLDSSAYKFALVYLDKDSVPELLITPYDGAHAFAGKAYIYTRGKLKQLKYAGSDYGRFIYSEKKSVVSNSAWVNRYGAIATFYYFTSKGKGIKLKKFEEVNSPKYLYKINGKKVSKKKYNSEYKKMVKKYPLKQIWPIDAFDLTTDNINNLIKNYKFFVVPGEKF